MKHRILLLCLWSLCLCLSAVAQTNRKIEELKNQRGQLQEKIRQSESLLLSTNKNVKSQLSDLAFINSQLKERRTFIAVIEKDMATLDSEISRTQKQLKQLQAELKQKQDRYAKSVRYLRKNRTIEEKLMFIFSAENLNQMYRRLRYVTEYADYQRVQGNQIKEKQAQIEAKRKDLMDAREEKTHLLTQRKEERAQIEAKEKQQRALVDKLQKRQRNLQAELKKQRQQSDRLNTQIDKLIEQEIAAAKRRAEEEERKRRAAAQKAEGKKSSEGKSDAPAKGNSKKSPMMAEYTGSRQLSGVFEKNKGHLPMPITGSYAIVSRFGQYTVEGLKNVKLDNKGIDIKGQKGAKARAIFDGEVSAVFQFGGYTNVLVRHGSYISVYCNLSSASVKQGQKLKTHDTVGTVATDTVGNTILHFQLRKETTKLNPEQWLGK